MKKLLAFIFTMGFGVLIILALSNNNLFPSFGMVDLTDRVSNLYITKGLNLPVIFGLTANAESGSANIVTSIVADYRSFDTLGEVTVLFISALGVSLLLQAPAAKRLNLNFKPNFMLKVASRLIFVIILVTSVYVITHGHLTPGGGFPGGAMIASAILLLYLADDEFRMNMHQFKILEGVMGSVYVIIGALGLVLASSFLENFLDTGVVGDLLSAGVVPIVYVLIGLKVGSELSNVIDHFTTIKEEEK